MGETGAAPASPPRGPPGRPRPVAGARLEQPRPYALLELLGRLLGEGDREDAVHRHAVLQHGRREALDHDRGLARAGAGREQQRTVALLHGEALLGGERRAPRTHGCPPRHTPGYAHPRGEHVAGHGRSSPAASWSASADALASAASSVAWNASESLT